MLKFFKMENLVKAQATLEFGFTTLAVVVLKVLSSSVEETTTLEKVQHVNNLKMLL